MKHTERKQARRFDLPYRGREVTDVVYSGASGTREELLAKLKAAVKVRILCLVSVRKQLTLEQKKKVMYLMQK